MINSSKLKIKQFCQQEILFKKMLNCPIYVIKTI